MLAEDARHQSFVRQYLYRLDLKPRDIRFEDLPSGRGCGEQWVRERYARAVGAYRDRVARAKTWLVVAIDADTDTVERRTNQLSEGLAQAGFTSRIGHEAIVHLIPKRHIETWILCLTGEDVDEETDYHNREVDPLIKSAATAFFDWSRSNAEPLANCVASLRVAIPELRRLV